MSLLKHLPITLLTCLFASPVVMLMIAWFTGWNGESASYFIRLFTQFVPTYALNSAVLLLMVLCITGTFGAVCPWLVSRYRLPCSRAMDVALMLPLAMPSYVSAMVYGRLLDEAGPMQALFGDWVPPIYSLGGLACVLSFALFPYVYIALRLVFQRQMGELIDAAQMLGVSEKKLLRRIALPAAWPALIAGLSLVAMETLAEFGASSLYGIQTFTTGIYHAWYSAFQPIAAAKLAGMLCVCVLLVLWLEKRTRAGRSYQNMSVRHNALTHRVQLSPFRRICALCVCAIPIAFGFFIPLLQLIYWASLAGALDAPLWSALTGSLEVASYVALLAALMALYYAFHARMMPGNVSAFCARTATLGYAIPGTVIAVALFIPLHALEQFISPGLFTMSIAAMVMGCTIRFLSVSYQLIAPAYEMIPRAQDEAAAMLGAGKMRQFAAIHLPALRAPFLAGLLFVAIDTIKELPASLMLRPFDHSTLAIRAYELAMDGRLVEASPACVMLVLTGALAVIMLNQLQRKVT